MEGLSDAGSTPARSIEKRRCYGVFFVAYAERNGLDKYRQSTGGGNHFICMIHIGISNKMKDSLYKKSITR